MIIFEVQVMWLLCGSEVQVVLREFFFRTIFNAMGRIKTSVKLDTRVRFY
jgi:hypothetical protein